MCVPGHWFSLTGTKQLLLSQLWLRHIQTLAVLFKVNQAQKSGYCCLLIVPINPFNWEGFPRVFGSVIGVPKEQ